jgi:hypothetical protein
MYSKNRIQKPELKNRFKNRIQITGFKNLDSKNLTKKQGFPKSDLKMIQKSEFKN